MLLKNHIRSEFFSRRLSYFLQSGCFEHQLLACDELQPRLVDVATQTSYELKHPLPDFCAKLGPDESNTTSVINAAHLKNSIFSTPPC